MLHLVRTDKTVYIVHASDPMCPRPGKGWLEVPAPVEGALTLKARAISAMEFVECVAISKMRAASVAAENGMSPTHVAVAATETAKAISVQEQLERTCLFSICARRSVVGVHGDNLPAHLVEAPGAIVDMLAPGACTDLGNWTIDVSLSGPDPFVVGASG